MPRMASANCCSVGYGVSQPGTGGEGCLFGARLTCDCSRTVFVIPTTPRTPAEALAGILMAELFAK